MVKKESSKILKYNGICETIENLNRGEIISPTKLFKGVNMNPNDTGRDLLDFYETLKEIGFVILRDKDGKITGILRTDERLDIKKELRDQRKEIIGMGDTLDELMELIKKKK